MIKPNDAYAYIYDQMEAARRAAIEHESKVLELRRHVTHLGGLLVLFRDETCMQCHGKGKVWVSYDQDDTKLESCKSCKGTGASTLAENVAVAEGQRDAHEEELADLQSSHQRLIREVIQYRTTWQSIETAPKDGTEVLVRCSNRAGLAGTVVAHYMAVAPEDHPPIDCGWYYWNGGMFNTVAKPTHWRPLPPFPDSTIKGKS